MTLYAVLCLLLLEALQEFTHWIITMALWGAVMEWSCFSKKLAGISPSTSKRLSQNTNSLAPHWLHLPAYTHFWNNRPAEHGASYMWYTWTPRQEILKIKASLHSTVNLRPTRAPWWNPVSESPYTQTHTCTNLFWFQGGYVFFLVIQITFVHCGTITKVITIGNLIF